MYKFCTCFLRFMPKDLGSFLSHCKWYYIINLAIHIFLFHFLDYQLSTMAKLLRSRRKRHLSMLKMESIWAQIQTATLLILHWKTCRDMHFLRACPAPAKQIQCCIWSHSFARKVFLSWHLSQRRRNIGQYCVTLLCMMSVYSLHTYKAYSPYR